MKMIGLELHPTPRKSRELVRIGKRAGTTGVILQRFRVKNFSDYPDSLICRAYNAVTGEEGTSDVHVAKPEPLRRTPYHGRTINSIAYNFNGNLQRTARKGVVLETQIIIRPYYANCIILAAKGIAGGTGVRVPNSSTAYIEWEEISAREWAAKAEDSVLADSATAGILVGNVQHNLGADRDPTTDDDVGSGYSATSMWVNNITNKLFGCTNPAAGAAVWKRLDAARRSRLCRIDTPAAEAFQIVPFPEGVTLKSVRHQVQAATNVVFNIESRAEAAPFTAGTDVWTVDKTATTTSAEVTAFDNQPGANTLLTVTVTSVSGTPVSLLIQIEYEVN